MIDPRQATRDRSDTPGEVLTGMGDALGIDSRGFAFSEAVVDPPYDLETLCLLLEHSNALRPNVDAYATNIDGFGHKLQAAIDFDAEDADERVAECIFLDLCPRNDVSGRRPALPADFKYKDGWRSSAAPAAKTGDAGVIDGWVEHLAEEMDKPYFQRLVEFVDDERGNHQVFPPEDEVFAAFSMTPLEEVKVVLLGQDPYHDDDQAHGLCFSVRPNIKIPPSLRNMYKELKTDVGVSPPKHGYLAGWARQGVLMLNTVLTVRAHEANSHQKKGWETFTDEVIKLVSRECDHVVFILWGTSAKKKAKLINKRKHTILKGTHPSPLSASRGFFGSKPYSEVNAALRKAGQAEIDWGQLPTN